MFCFIRREESSRQQPAGMSKTTATSFDAADFAEKFLGLDCPEFKPRETSEWNNERLDRFTFKIQSPTTSNTELFIDCSKEKISTSFIDECLTFQEGSIKEGIERMRSGEAINYTEDRKVWHVALRDLEGDLLKQPLVHKEVTSVLKSMEEFSNEIHVNHTRLGATGKKFKYLVNIGIGGSDLGPKMVCEALRPFWLPGVRSFFVSNIDGTHLMSILDEVDIEETLFVICSKTFTTKETLMNARSAKKIVCEHFQSEEPHIISKHFCAISTNLAETRKFGIDDNNVFQFWDWVGGRLSVWSAIGLSVVFQVGYSNFELFLKGANNVDKHFFNCESLRENIPLNLAIIKLYNLNKLGHQTHAILPYDQNLQYLAPYLQQLEMESNGKTFRRDGSRATLKSSAVVFGQPGTNGQHAFYQFLHQDQTQVSTTFMVASNPANLSRHSPTKQHILKQHHTTLVANCVAQTEALAVGKSDEEVVAELASKITPQTSIEMLKSAKTFEGNRASTFIAYAELTPFMLGQLIALFEHVTFCCGMLAGINSFDQFGVELGKCLALGIEKELRASDDAASQLHHDLSTNRLVKYFSG